MNPSMMSLSWIFYHRPAKSLKTSEKVDYEKCTKGVNGNFTAAGIPESLSLDRILKSECCSVCIELQYQYLEMFDLIIWALADFYFLGTSAMFGC